jgi:hypothetical protein
MGKKAKKEKRKKFEDSDGEEDSDFEKLRAYAEKNGKNIWEVCMNDLEADEEDEEEEVEEIEIDKINENIIKYNNLTESEVKHEIAEEVKCHEDKINIGLQNLSINSDDNDCLPKRIKINDEITKILQLNDKIHNEENNNYNSIKLGNTMITFEYPKEDTRPVISSDTKTKTKKKNKTENEEKGEKKKNKKKDQDIDFCDEDIKRLEEAKRRREEFAFLEKIRIEEEADRKIEEIAKKVKEENAKKDKNKYKPKPKKKKGK